MKDLERFFRKNGLVYQFGEYFVGIVDKPEQTFTEPESLPIIDLIRIVAADGFGVELEQKRPEGIRDRLTKVDCVSVLYAPKDVLGFASARIHPNFNLFFLHGMVVSNKFQGKGGGLALVRDIV